MGIHRAYIKANTKQCGGYAVSGSRYCFAHDLAQAMKRRAAQRKGGEAGRAVVIVMVPAGLPAEQRDGAAGALTICALQAVYRDDTQNDTNGEGQCRSGGERTS